MKRRVRKVQDQPEPSTLLAFGWRGATLLALATGNLIAFIATLICLVLLWKTDQRPQEENEHNLDISHLYDVPDKLPLTIPQQAQMLDLSHLYDVPQMSSTGSAHQAAKKSPLVAVRKAETRGNRVASGRCFRCSAPVHGPLPTTNSWQAECTWSRKENKFLHDYAEQLKVTYPLELAKRFCVELGKRCSGVTCESDDLQCTLRSGNVPQTSPGSEISYIKSCFEPEGCQESQKMPTAPEGSSKEIENAAVVVIAHNRESDLKACLDSLLSLKDIGLFKLYVSLDDLEAEEIMRHTVSQASRSHGKDVSIWSIEERVIDPKKDNAEQQKWFRMNTGKIAHHYWSAFEKAFMDHRHEYVIFVEEDLVFSPDFLALFRSTFWLLERDPSLWCVSAWNDIGFAISASDQCRLFRTSYFPGLGFMIGRETWLSIRDRWPAAPTMGWDYWMRTAFRRENKECIAPEVSRSHHFSARGASVVTSKQVAFFEAMALADQPNSCSSGGLEPCNLFGDVSYLLKEPYEALLQEAFRTARPMVASATLVKKDYECEKSGAQLGVFSRPEECAAVTRGTYLCSHTFSFSVSGRCRCCKAVGPSESGRSHPSTNLYLSHQEFDPDGIYYFPYSQENYVAISSTFGIRPEAMEAVIPQDVRSEHHGFIAGRHTISRALVLLADKRSFQDYLPAELRMRRHPKLKSVPADRGLSCAEACRSKGLECQADQLYFLNNCVELEQQFGCKFCAHQAGAELPVFVDDENQATFGQCLVTFISPFQCETKHPSTRRLCACV